MSRSNEFQHQPQPPGQPEPQLSAEDQRAVDALAQAGFDRKAVAFLGGDDARRVDALGNMLGLLRDYPVDDADDTLIHATLARIDQHEKERAARMVFDARQDLAAAGTAGRGGRRIRIPDFISVAAVILIAVSVLWPVLTSVRQKSIDQACANNLQYLGYAFGNYAADNQGALPIAQAGVHGGWDTVRNVLNLQPMIQGSYCEYNHLNCPGHQHHAHGVASGPSYSYRWFTPRAPVGWGTAMGGRVTVVLGDLNPVIEAARSGTMIPPLSMSINHAGRGQNVLASDGATMWLQQPLVGRGDNIWLPNQADSLRPGLAPDDPMDVFLAH